MDIRTQTAIAATKWPDRAALVEVGRSLTFAELEQAVTKTAAGLAELGVRPGDRLGSFADNCSDVVVWVWAGLRLGATIVPLRPGFDGETARMIEQECQLACTLVDDERAAILTGPTVRVGDLPSTDQSPLSARAQMAQAPAAILYSSGSTSVPKGAIISRSALEFSVESHVDAVGQNARDMSIAQVALGGGFVLRNQLLASALSGASLFVAATPGASAVLKLLGQYPITLTYQSPALLYDMVNEAARAGVPPNCRLRAAIVSGDAVPTVLYEQFAESFDAPVCEVLGMSELGTYAYNPIGSGAKPGSCGRVVKGVSARIDASAGEVGEIVLSGAPLATAYLNRPDDIGTVFRDGEMRTGDLGQYDEDGFLWFRGRIKNIIVRGGYNVSPVAVESVLERHPKIARAAVVGRPDQRLGQSIVAFIQPADPLDPPEPAAVREFAAINVDSASRPDDYVVVTEFPLGPSGKINRLALADWPS